MKTKNFPARVAQRRINALKRAGKELPAPADSMLAVARSIRTKRNRNRA